MLRRVSIKRMANLEGFKSGQLVLMLHYNELWEIAPCAIAVQYYRRAQQCRRGKTKPLRLRKYAEW